jgi:hypothetical protein
MHSHLRVVAFLQIGRALLLAFGAVASFLGMGLGAVGTLLVGDIFTSLGLGIGAVLTGLFMGALALASLFVGLGLLGRKSWARYVAVVLALFGLFNWPLGTIMSVYTLWVLFHEDTKRSFGSTTYA